jgi:hypothetical protein
MDGEHDQTQSITDNSAPKTPPNGLAEHMVESPEGDQSLGTQDRSYTRRRLLINLASATLCFGWGVGAGYWMWGRRTEQGPAVAPTVEAELEEVRKAAEPTAGGLPHTFLLPITYQDLGPRLVGAGAFTVEGFSEVLAKSGRPIAPRLGKILTEGSDEPIVFDHDTGQFLLNLFWAAGLTNNNPILRRGAMVERSEGRVEQFASTAGWTLASKPLSRLYSGSELFRLSAVQQARLEEAAAAIYRPCCNNPTSFPDCNHGMAMLGLLELMAQEGRSVEEMLEAAKMVNAFWYPEQSHLLALYYQARQGLNFVDIPAREAVSAAAFSGNGFGEVRAWMTASGTLQAPGGGGSSCSL